MKKVLVIGANSYIGRKFYEYIKKEKEYEIHIDMVSASDGSWRNVDFSQYNSILHLAAIVHKKEKKNMKELYDTINHRLAVEVAIKAKESGVNQFIFMSTAAVYGNEVTHITKDMVPNPNTLYGKSKLDAEYKLKQMDTEKFCVAIIRPPMVYGENCKGNYSRLVKLATYIPIYPKVHNKRSMIQIENLSRYIEETIRNTSGGMFLPQDESYKDTIMIIKSIRETQGKKIVLVPGTAWLVRLLMKHIGGVKKMFGDWYYEL